MSHSIQLPSGEQIHYTLERRQRRTVGLKITQEGLIVHAPKRIAQTYLESLIVLKADWILKKLKARSANQHPPMQWQHGDQLLLLGNTITLVTKQDTRSRAVEYTPGFLQLAMPNHSEPSAVERKYCNGIKNKH